jgi:hypothetical protein
MINKTSMALVAALIAGSAGIANAESMTQDSNTGLISGIYYQPLAELQAQGLPLSASAQAYLKAHSQGAAVHQAKAKNVARSRTNYEAVGYGATNQVPAFDDKQSGHW